MFQPDLFSTGPAYARGPRQSQQLLDSLGKDHSLKNRVVLAVVACSGRRGLPVTDDDATEWMEAQYRRRFQRNVIARTRGLLEAEGWFVQVPDVIGRTGRMTRAVTPSDWCLDVMGS